TNDDTSPSTDTSTRTAVPPTSSATVCAPSPSRSATTMARAPSDANRRHRARPIPFPPPVTTTCLSASSIPQNLERGGRCFQGGVHDRHRIVAERQREHDRLVDAGIGVGPDRRRHQV